MKNYLFLIIAFFITLTSLNAQEQSEEINNISLSNQIKKGVSEAIIQQITDGNTASILQNSQGAQLGNFTQIIQKEGIGNNSIITQIGTGIGLSNIQNGHNNISNISLSGQNIILQANQYGDGNTINSIVENAGTGLREVLLEQVGNHNQIIFEFLNRTDSRLSLEESVSITQTGNGHNLNLKLDNIDSPVNVTQNPGPGGEGMQVTIIRSAFPEN
jgi:hypothetical protein